MKRVKHIFLITFLLCIGSTSMQLNAQGRGNSNGKKHQARDHRHDHSDKGKHHHKHDHKYLNKEFRHGHGDRSVKIVHTTYVHDHHHGCDHRVVVKHYDRPRYVYYADYNVYFDFHRQVYITLSGRNWMVSSSIPVAMQRVDIRRASYREVHYYDDDFVGYLGHGRPMYGKVYAIR